MNYYNELIKGYSDQIKRVDEQSFNVFNFFNVLNFQIDREFVTDGKKLRSLIVIISAGIAGNLSDLTPEFCTIIETIHTASLIHDDVVDSAFERRGRNSINSLHGDKFSVLAGDYLIVQSLKLLKQLELSDYNYSVIIDFFDDMVKGQILEIHHQKNMNLTIDEYEEIISLKTASFFKFASQIAMVNSDKDNDYLNNISEYFYTLGILFQISDDLSDYNLFGIENGKKEGNDYFNKRMTLPTILLKRKMSKEEFEYLFNNVNEKNYDKIKELMKAHEIRKDIEKHCRKYITLKDRFFSKIDDNIHKNNLKIFTKLVISN